MNEEICQNLLECEIILKSVYNEIAQQKNRITAKHIRIAYAENEKAKREKCRKAYFLKQSGKTYKEIAQELDITPFHAQRIVSSGKRISKIKPICLFKK
jgi:hypothetical protein